MRCNLGCFLRRYDLRGQSSSMCKLSSMMKLSDASFGARNLKTTDGIKSTLQSSAMKEKLNCKHTWDLLVCFHALLRYLTEVVDGIQLSYKPRRECGRTLGM